jgi:hypothetical protein
MGKNVKYEINTLLKTIIKGNSAYVRIDKPKQLKGFSIPMFRFDNTTHEDLAELYLSKKDFEVCNEIFDFLEIKPAFRNQLMWICSYSVFQILITEGRYKRFRLDFLLYKECQEFEKTVNSWNNTSVLHLRDISVNSKIFSPQSLELKHIIQVSFATHYLPQLHKQRILVLNRLIKIVQNEMEDPKLGAKLKSLLQSSDFDNIEKIVTSYNNSLKRDIFNPTRKKVVNKLFNWSTVKKLGNKNQIHTLISLLFWQLNIFPKQEYIISFDNKKSRRITGDIDTLKERVKTILKRGN